MKRLLLGLAAAVVFAPPALARAPQPVRAVATTLFSGRWYEIARTPNMAQKDCQGSSSDFSGWVSGAFAVTQVCHKGSPQGPVKTFNAKAKILPASGNAKMKMSFFGGLVSQEYWILDHADDDNWAIMATPGGNYVWVLSRRPVLDPAAKAVALQRVHTLGYDLSRLAYPQQ
ncbi:MAG TPA: lipocalin family protein [Caulobacteraceae bacterium]